MYYIPVGFVVVIVVVVVCFAKIFLKTVVHLSFLWKYAQEIMGNMNKNWVKSEIYNFKSILNVASKAKTWGCISFL